MDEEMQEDNHEVNIAEPIIIDLGKQKSKRIKNLKKGRGKLWYEVEGVIDEVSEMLGEELEGNTILPLILVYRRKPKRRSMGKMFGW